MWHLQFNLSLSNILLYYYIINMVKLITAFSIIRNGSMVQILYNGGNTSVTFKSANVVIQVETGNFVSMADYDKVFLLDYTASTTPTGVSPIAYADALANLINDPQDSLDLARKIVIDKKVIHVFGTNQEIGTTEETIWFTGGG